MEELWEIMFYFYHFNITDEMKCNLIFWQSSINLTGICFIFFFFFFTVNWYEKPQSVSIPKAWHLQEHWTLRKKYKCLNSILQLNEFYFLCPFSQTALWALVFLLSLHRLQNSTGLKLSATRTIMIHLSLHKNQ